MWDFIDREIKKQEENEADKSRNHCRIAAGQPCPQCGRGQLEYNGLLNLTCSLCGYELTASFT